jgi:hypothetical protein
MEHSRRLPSHLSAQEMRRPRSLHRMGWRSRFLYVLYVLLSLTLLFVQASHPALHPHEVIDPGADRQHACPLSHAAAALPIALPLLLYGGLPLERLHDPLPWIGHTCFIHHLVPRPPPAQLS